jgi:hypothetical protein
MKYDGNMDTMETSPPTSLTKNDLRDPLTRAGKTGVLSFGSEEQESR